MYSVVLSKESLYIHGSFDRVREQLDRMRERISASFGGPCLSLTFAKPSATLTGEEINARRKD